jgi:uncharacterized membrane protein YkvA (DUF1232 family)
LIEGLYHNGKGLFSLHEERRKRMRKAWKKARLLFHTYRLIPFLVGFFCSHEIPLSKKMTYVLIIFAYFVFPFDLLPDWLGIFGIFDDVAIFMWILQKMIEASPHHLKRKYGV